VNSLQNIQVLKDFLTKGHGPENDDWCPSGSFYIVWLETENPRRDDPAKLAAGTDALGWKQICAAGFADAGGFDLTLMELACVCLISMTASIAAIWLRGIR
jgi:hypothetical protein